MKISEKMYQKMPDEIKKFFNKLPNPSSDEVLELFPQNQRQGNMNQQVNASSIYGSKSERNKKTVYANQYGSASRFFYCAKASKKERNLGCEQLEAKNVSHDGRDKHIENPYQRHENIQSNNHPTIKPLKLMEYLTKLVTPVNGTVLDPFMGSGTTGIACINNNFNFIGIELEKDYFKIAEQRINHAK